jgi:hypothetical protein
MVSPFKEVDEFGEPVDLLRKYPSFDRNIMTWDRQTSLSVFNGVGYADHEKRPNWDLCGHGLGYADCGSVKVKGCDNYLAHKSGKVLRRLYRRNCRRKQCPICYEGWASAEAERALIRLASYVVGRGVVKALISDLKRQFARHPKRVFHEALVFRLEKAVKDGRKDRSRGLAVIHVVLSPPQDVSWDRLVDFRRCRSLAYEIAKKHGFRGGSLIPHPYRLRCVKCKSKIADFKKICSKCGGSSFEWMFSPHFHGVGFGWIHGVKEGYREHGWVVRNLGIRKSVYWTFQYLLSHAGVSVFHTVTWFGSLAYRKLPFVAKLGSVRELCPECGAVLRPMQWCLADQDPPSLEYSEVPYENDSWENSYEWRCV